MLNFLLVVLLSQISDPQVMTASFRIDLDGGVQGDWFEITDTSGIDFNLGVDLVPVVGEEANDLLVTLFGGVTGCGAIPFGGPQSGASHPWSFGGPCGGAVIPNMEAAGGPASGAINPFSYLGTGPGVHSFAFLEFVNESGVRSVTFMAMKLNEPMASFAIRVTDAIDRKFQDGYQLIQPDYEWLSPSVSLLHVSDSGSIYLIGAEDENLVYSSFQFYGWS